MPLTDTGIFLILIVQEKERENKRERERRVYFITPMCILVIIELCSRVKKRRKENERELELDYVFSR